MEPSAKRSDKRGTVTTKQGCGLVMMSPSVTSSFRFPLYTLHIPVGDGSEQSERYTIPSGSSRRAKPGPSGA